MIQQKLRQDVPRLTQQILDLSVQATQRPIPTISIACGQEMETFVLGKELWTRPTRPVHSKGTLDQVS